MSIDSAKAYVARLVADPAFGRQIVDARDSETRVKILKSEGYSFTKSELDSVVSGLPKDRLAALAPILNGITDYHV